MGCKADTLNALLLMCSAAARSFKLILMYGLGPIALVDITLIIALCSNIRCPPFVRSLFTGVHVEFVRQQSLASLSKSINELKHESQEGTKAVLVRAGFVIGSIGLEI